MEVNKWFYANKGENNTTPIGPVSERDLDVLIRTSEINSNTLVFRQGFKEWQMIYKVTELKHLFDWTQEMLELESKNQIKPTGNTKKQQSRPNVLRMQEVLASEKQKPEQSQSEQVDENQEQRQNEEDYLKQLESDPQKIIDLVENMIKTNFYKGEDGLWNIYDDATKTWKKQAKDPENEIQELRQKLLASFQNVNGLNENLKNALENSNFDIKKLTQPKKDTSNMTEEQKKQIQKNRQKTKRAAEKRKQKLLEMQSQFYVYVTGLPSDIQLKEIQELFSRAGPIKTDPETDELKIKLYNLPDSQECKGDALICYYKRESSELAIQMLNEREIRPNCQIQVERAKFEMTQKANNGTFEKPIEQQAKIDKVQHMKAINLEKKKFGWEEDDQIQGLKIVILKNVFSPQDIEANGEVFIQELEQDIKQECQFKLGKVEKIRIFDNHADGVVKIKFKDAVAAEGCIKMMNGRLFDGRVLSCQFWDGTTNYDKALENQHSQEQRLEQFGKWLEKGSSE